MRRRLCSSFWKRRGYEIVPFDREGGCVYYQHLLRDQYRGPQIPADASPGKEDESGGRGGGGGLLRPGRRRDALKMDDGRGSGHWKQQENGTGGDSGRVLFRMKAGSKRRYGDGYQRRAKEYEALTIHRIADHTRAFIKVTGRLQPVLQLLHYPLYQGAGALPEGRRMCEAEVERLVAGGYKEMVLTGIHLSSYGVDFRDRRGREGHFSI